jgi:transposase
MAKALSVDLRERMIAAIDGGLSCRKAAEHCGVSAASRKKHSCPIGRYNARCLKWIGNGYF